MVKGPGLSMGISGRGELHGRLIMTPPIANTLDAAIANAPHLKSRELSDEVLEAIGTYVRSEDPTKPYTDAQVLEYMKSQGHGLLAQRDIALARQKLGISPSQERYFP